MTKAEAFALAQSLMACHQQDVRPSRLAQLLREAARLESRNDEEPRDDQGRVVWRPREEPRDDQGRVVRRPRERDWRETAVEWLRRQPDSKATIREYAASAGLRRATAYARLMALVEDGLAETVSPGVYRAL